MSNDEEVHDFLSGGGAPSVSFPSIGTTVKGIVLTSEIRTQTDLEGNDKTFDDGSPRKQLVVTLQTDMFDDEIPNDDGQRRVFIKGQMTKALKDNLRQQGMSVENFIDGGHLTVSYTGDQPSEKKGYNPTKLYTVAYTAPAASSVGAAAQQYLANEEPF